MFSSIRRSISRKFMVAVMATTFTAVFVSGLANLAYDINDFRTSVLEELGAQADILSQVSTAALEFEDRPSAETTLGRLGARPNVHAAAIYRADGSLFVSYAAAGQPQALSPPSRPSAAGHIIDGDKLHIFRPILRAGEKVGTIYLRSAYPLDERIERGLKMFAAALAVSLVVAALAAGWLQRAVTMPVKAMTRAVRELVKQRDFSQRVSKTTEDETGMLVDAFNSMLSEIGRHAARLEQSNASLTHEIAQRARIEQALNELNASLEQRIAARSLELEKANEQLHQSQKMEAIGQLTGGVAHDFNNVLQVVGGNLQLLGMTLPDDAAAQRRLETARFATERGAKLASQLLSFARRQPLQPTPTDLGRVLRDMDDMLRRALGESVEVESAVSGGLWNTMVDPNQLENVILNLAINARDAMQGSGKLTLELGNAMLDDHYAAREPEVVAGQYVMLAISDTGCGMPPEVVARAFEPFFTTKREGEGTGLGLSMAFGFVKQSSGHIKIYSEPDSGTTIKIYLPRSHQAEEQQFNMGVGEVVGGSETVLVVEDDLAVQGTAVDMLTQLGYRVLRADNGDAAVAILHEQPRIDMLFTDVVMPGKVRSPELARIARTVHPSIAVLYTSGYTRNAIVHGGRLDPGVELISKPYRADDLARKIRHVFANARQVEQLRHDRAQPAPPASHTGDGLRLLVVEDDPDNRLLLQELLGMLGHRVTAVASGEDGLAAFQPGQFDALVTDIQLPGISGIVLAETLRKMEPGLKVVVASGAGQAPVAASGKPYLSLAKPYQVEQMDALLRGALERGAAATA
ncbi:response regulator [Massilia yuzhufengensis]|uniref:histidine kinase n=1 Tax=Massilia yuzhufengensis TaxID=1164594 RepID=A0A1I1E650_9BURK|nr:response regulator [Massilia yuzhufengensis]SFB82607.1 HAMP domain-containing protein [Massilia yuzhufengensis]